MVDDGYGFSLPFVPAEKRRYMRRETWCKALNGEDI